MDEQRLKILTMLENGKINASEANKLLSALSNDEKNEVTSTRELPKYFYVQVDSPENKVNVKVPISLLKAGVNLASLLPAEVQGEVNQAMEENGIKFSLSDINKENLDEIILALRELEVTIDGENEKVKVYCD
jgi:membrane peptidoglycan carboxypeptidase